MRMGMEVWVSHTRAKRYLHFFGRILWLSVDCWIAEQGDRIVVDDFESDRLVVKQFGRASDPVDDVFFPK